MDEVTIKNCPFCGSEAKYHKSIDDTYGYRVIGFIRCENPSCHCMTPAVLLIKGHETIHKKKEAYDIWNRRV